MILMIVAGNETTTAARQRRLLGHENRPQLDRVADPELVPLWTEERLCGTTTRRMVVRAASPTTAEERHHHSEGDPPVLLLVGSANRDAEVSAPTPISTSRSRCQWVSLMSFGIGTPPRRPPGDWKANIGLEEVAAIVKNSRDRSGQRGCACISVNVRGFANLPMKVQAR